VKLLDALGVDRVADFARRMGIGGELPRNLTLALGTGEVTPLELVNAYATVAAMGKRADPVFVLRVRDRTGAVLHEPAPGAGLEAPIPPPGGAAPGETAPVSPTAGAPGAASASGVAFPEDPAFKPAGYDAPAEPWSVPADGTRPDVAYVLLNMMRDVIENGTGAGAKALARPAAAKTGTAQDHRDAWFVGFTPELVAGVWIGFDDHSPLGSRETGGGAALPAWLSFMQAAVGGRPVSDFAPPPGLEQAAIDVATGLRTDALPGPGAAQLVFLTGTAPAEAARPGPAPDSFFFDGN
jgi:penicillin-binding protein 1A